MKTGYSDLKGFCLIVSFFVLSAPLYAQAIQLEWAKSMGGSGLDGGGQIVTDVYGNIYQTGSFRGTVDFDPGVSTFNMTATGYEDAYILKLDSNGSFLWAKPIEGIKIFSKSMCLDSAGNIYIMGGFESSADFDPSSAAFNLTSRGEDDVYILKLDSNGNFLWVKSFGGPKDEFGASMSVDNHYVYVTGYFRSDTADFDPGPAMFNLHLKGKEDIFILKIGNDGFFQWAKSIGDKAFDIGNSIITDGSGNVHVAGSFEDTVDFDPGASIYKLISKGGTYADAFVLKLDSNGNFIRALQFGGNHFDSARLIAFDSLENILIGGSFNGTVDFDPGPSVFYMSGTGSKIFVQKLDSAGNFLWAKSYGDPYGTGISSIFLDKMNNIYLTGLYSGEVDFDPDTSTFNLTSIGVRNSYILKLDENGTFEWAVSLGGKGWSYATDFTMDLAEKMYLSSGYEDTLDVDPSTDVFNLISNGSLDIFLLKYSLNQCFVKPLDTSITKTGVLIQSNEINAEYQWLNCSNSYAIIPGETGKFFNPTLNGNYAVEVTKRGCTDTSACVIISTVGIEEYSSFGVSVSPNPATNLVHLNWEAQIPHRNTELRITDALGKVMYKQRITSNKMQLDVSAYPKGLYFVQLNRGEKTVVRKLVVR